MKAPSKKRNEKTIWKYLAATTLILATLIGAAGEINALTITMSPTGNHTIQEQSTLIINITTTGNNGTVSYNKDLAKGSLEKQNDNKAIFTWTPEYGDAGTSNQTYNLAVTAEDGITTASTETWITVTKKNNPPKIVEKSAQGTINTKTTKIQVTTDRSATCKYSLNDKSYNEMEYTMNTNNQEKTLHEGTTPTLSQGSNTIYVLCKDEMENYMETPETISIQVTLKPTASITLSPSPPLRAGLVRVNVAVSENLIAPPEVKYSFDDDSAQRSITMVGSGSSWHGYMVIHESSTKRVGTFTFKGISHSNVEGTDITSGKIFIVDTQTPARVVSIEAINQHDRIRLAWRYHDEEADNIKEYRIYRRVGSGGTDYVDYYTTTSNSYYYDRDVTYNEAYYYKVSAVDEAGNEGELSREAFVTHAPTREQDTEPQEEKLSAALLYELREKSEEFERLLMDINSAQSRLERSTEPGKQEAIQSLNVLARIQASKNKITNLRNQFMDLESKPMSRVEFDLTTERLLEEARQEFLSMPLDVEIVDSTSYQEFIDDDKTVESIEEYLSREGVSMERADVRNYVEEMKRIQDTATISVLIIKSNMVYAESKESYAVIRKTISSDPIENAVILELIPGWLAGSASHISFSEEPVVIRENPLVKWSAGRLTRKTITYSFRTDESLVDLREVKTIIAQERSFELPGSDITGRATTDTDRSGAHPLFFPIIIGILVSILLGAYYLKMERSGKEGGPGILKKKYYDLRDKMREKKMNIMPKKKDDSHKKIDIAHFRHEPKISPVEKEERNLPMQTEEETSVDTKKEERPVLAESGKEKKALDELEEIREKLKDYKKNISTENVNKDVVKGLHDAVNEIKHLCEEMHEKSLLAYAERTRKELEETLEYIKGKKERKVTGEAPHEKRFFVIDGGEARTARELCELAKSMDENVFSHHVNEHKNDFSKWISDVFGEEELAAKLLEEKEKEKIIGILEKHS